MESKILTIDNLQYYHENINERLNNKQDSITDLATIRSNAEKGASAEQNAKNYVDQALEEITPIGNEQIDSLFV